jgi:hypothetical protein
LEESDEQKGVVSLPEQRTECMVRTIVVLLHTARVQLRIGDPKAANRLVDIADSVSFFSFFFFFSSPIILIATK